MIIDAHPFSLKGDSLVHHLNIDNSPSEPVDKLDNQPLE